MFMVLFGKFQTIVLAMANICAVAMNDFNLL